MTANQTLRAVSLIADHIVQELAHSLNQTADSIDPDLPFVDMGADSLILAEALQDINRRYRVSLPIGEIYERVNTIAKVAQFIHQHGDWQSVFQAAAPAAPRPEVATVDAAGDDGGDRLPEAAAAPVATPAGHAGSQSIEQIVRHQLELMERQLTLLAKPPAPAGRPVQQPAAAAPGRPATASVAPVAAVQPVPAPTPAAAVTDRFSAFSIRLETDARKDDAEKVRHIGDLTTRFNGKTPQSKQMAQTYRRVLADNRVSAGFRPLLKEIVYPILAEQGQGSRLVDIDGNEYVDFTMGFGVHLFGHSPAFVVESVRAQFERGMPIGPQSPLAGRVAELICELTGHDRAVFCNSGTEATMTAVRLARAKTGRDKIVVFKNSYHGTFDGFLARTGAAGSDTRPASLGTPASVVQDTIVLDYGEASALDYIAQHHRDIAAVMVEPVQSRMPSLQPQEFLKDLRRVTEEGGVALIFDEVISGFRCAQGGAQEHFGVRADICTYGKIIGGGMPIGVVAGAAAYMDGVDGGWWQYGDGSYPTASTIFFAGTFSKHPLTMAAAIAVLEHIKANGKTLYPTLNDNTRRLAERLNAAFEEAGVDIKVEHFSSLFRFSSKGNIDLFFNHLMDEGIYIWEGRNCFVSTAHDAADMDRLVEAVRKICAVLVPLGLLPVKEGARPAAGTFAITDAQQRFWELERSGPDGSVACNVCFGFRFDAPVDLDRLSRAVTAACRRQDALWYRFDPARGTQQPRPPQPGRLEPVGVDAPATATLVDGLLADEQKAPLELAAGQNIRTRLYQFADGVALLSICAHHLVCDGWGLNVLLLRIAELYNRGPEAQDDGRDISYLDWINHETQYKQSDRYQEDRAFWQGVMETIVSRQKNNGHSTIQRGNTVGAKPGGRASLTIGEAVTTRFLAKARSEGVTPFTWLLGGFQVFLNRVYQDKLPVIGIPFGNRTSRLKDLVGNCVNLVPFLPFHGRNISFEPTLAYTKQAMNDLFGHSRFPYHEMCAAYQALTSQAHETPVNITFNVEPITEMPRFGEAQPALMAPVNSRIEFDLMFNIFLMKKELRIELDYNTDLFAEDMIYGWLYLFAKLIENHSAAVARDASAGVALTAPSELVA